MAGDRLRQIAAAAAQAALSIARPDYFAGGGRRGEAEELRADLNSDVALVRKEAVKKVIAAMTLGKDVGALFADVLKNIQTDDLELKKLVYLYLSSHAAAQPELVVLAVNTFCKDACDPRSAQLRGLAVRAMGCLRVPTVVDHLCEPLGRALRDDAPYVRRAAAQCVAKFHAASPLAVEDAGLLDELRDMISGREDNAAVLAAAIAALSDTCSSSGASLEFTPQMAARLSTALPDAGEWGQLPLMAALETYVPSDGPEASRIIASVLPRMQHANAAVVLGAVRVVLRLLPLSDDAELCARSSARVASSLVALASSSTPEMQWLGLRSLLLAQTSPSEQPLLPPHAARLFFVRCNDSAYVKAAKLDVLAAIACAQNAEDVVDELAGVCRRDVEPAAVRRALAALPQIASNVPSSGQHVLEALFALLRSSPSLVPFGLPALADMSRVLPSGALLESMCALLEELFPSAALPDALLSDEDASGALCYLVGVHGGDDPALASRVAAPLLRAILAHKPAMPEALAAALRLHAAAPSAFARADVDAALASAGGDRAAVYARMLSRASPAQLRRVLQTPSLPASSLGPHIVPGDGAPEAYIGTTAALLPPDPCGAGRPLRLGRVAPVLPDGVAHSTLGSPVARGEAPAAVPDLLDLDGTVLRAPVSADATARPSPVVDLLAD